MSKTGAILLFDGFETLDAFGPVEVLGSVPNLELKYWSRTGRAVCSPHGFAVDTDPIPKKLPELFFLLIPGGKGTREGVKNEQLLQSVDRIADEAKYVLTVCTGSALLAAAGWLEEKRATSNNQAFEWVRDQSYRTDWKPEARWVVDEGTYTSSGISAGIDMSLAFVRDTYGSEQAEEISRKMEYAWDDDPDHDPFYKAE